jgi:ribosomal-protein-alanine N-acetyltransferase
VIKGEKIDLKPFTPEDHNFLYKWNNDPEYTGKYEPHEQITRKELKQWLQKDKLGQRWYIIQTKKGKKIGQIVTRNQKNNTIQIGYRITPPARNKGHCTAAVNTLINHHFSNLTINRIKAEANPRNTASIRVLEKTGFTKTGYKEKAIEINGVWMDGAIYTLQRGDWLKAHRRAHPRY